MSDPKMIKEIKAAVTIPVMAKSRIGHFVECQILQEIGADYIDESEVLTMADALIEQQTNASLDNGKGASKEKAASCGRWHEILPTMIY